MHRADFKNAPYNPREISATAKKRLKDNIDRVGLLSPIVVNRRTNFIVSGHQRLAVLDALEGRKDYWLDVSLVDLDDKAEREQNVFFNNEFAHGTWDLALLRELLPTVGFEQTGMTEREVLDLFAVPDMSSLFRSDRAAAAALQNVERDAYVPPPAQPAQPDVDVSAPATLDAPLSRSKARTILVFENRI